MVFALAPYLDGTFFVLIVLCSWLCVTETTVFDACDMKLSCYSHLFFDEINKHNKIY